MRRLSVFKSPLALALALAIAPATAAAEDVAMPDEGGPMKRADMPQGTADPAPTADTAKVKKTAKGNPMPEDGGKMDRAKMPEGGVTPEAPHPNAPPKKQLPLDIQWNGFVRTQLELVQDGELPYVGRSDGFRVGNARLEMNISYGEKLSSRVSIDASTGLATSLNDVNANFAVAMVDAYLDYAFADKMTMRVGRFRPPHDVTLMGSVSGLPFVDRPVGTRGVLRSRGVEVDGLSPSRQLGVMLHSEKLGLSKDGFDVGYAVAVTNGRTLLLQLNDNDSYAGYARLTLRYGDWLRLNAGGFMDRRTTGELPDLTDEDVLGVEGSLELSFGDLSLQGQLLLHRSEHPTTGLEASNAMGVHGQWAYKLWKLLLAYRFAMFDPRSTFDADQIIEHTAAISYLADTLPLRLTLEGTLADEQTDVANNRLEALLQLRF